MLKKPLQDSFNSLNSSVASVYESAAEDSDSSLLFYSFTNSPSKSFNESNVHDISSELDNSLVSETDNKENTTVIMRNSDTDQDLVGKQEVHNDEMMEVDESVPTQTAEHEQEKTEVNNIGQQKHPDSSSEDPSRVTNTKTDNVIPEITVEDPNQNLINPFTQSESAASSNDFKEVLASVPEENRMSIETDNVTRRKVADVNKKSASKIPIKNHFYSPLKRKSLDKKSKVIGKPETRRTVYVPRRTVYETRSTVKPKASILPPADSRPATAKSIDSKPPSAKVAMQKCTFSGCLREFHTTKAMQEHVRTHKNPQPVSSTSSHSSFKCKWCDKIFVLETALNSHMVEKCSKIPFGDKRKLLAQRDKTNQTTENNKRKTIFAAPAVPKKRSPSKRQTLNKSGVMITPKKTLKCECGKLFTNVLEFAQHTVWILMNILCFVTNFFL